MKRILFIGLFLFSQIFFCMGYSVVDDPTFDNLVQAINEFDEQGVKDIIGKLDELSLAQILIKKIDDQDKNTPMHLALNYAMNSAESVQNGSSLKIFSVIANKAANFQFNDIKVFTTENRYKRTPIHEAFFLVMSSRNDSERSIRSSVFETFLSDLPGLLDSAVAILTFKPTIEASEQKTTVKSVANDENKKVYFKDPALHFAFELIIKSDSQEFCFDQLGKFIKRINISVLEGRAGDVFNCTDERGFNLLHKAVEVASYIDDAGQPKYLENVFKPLLALIGQLTHEDIKKIFKKRTLDGFTPFNLAIRLGISFDFINAMFNCLKSLTHDEIYDVVNSTDSFDNTLLFNIIEKSFEGKDGFDYFNAFFNTDISKNVDFAVQNKNKITPLRFAVNQAIIGFGDKSQSENILKALVKRIGDKLALLKLQAETSSNKQNISSFEDKIEQHLNIFTGCLEEIQSAGDLKRKRITNEGQSSRVESSDFFIKGLLKIINDAVSDFEKYKI